MLNKKLLLILIFLMSISATAKVKPRHGRLKTTVAVEARAEASTDVFTDDIHRKSSSQSDAPLKAKGSPKVPVILVQFVDKKFTSGLEANNKECTTEEDAKTVATFFDKFCNGEGGENSYYKGAGSYGAIREYFRDQSAGVFTPEFVVLGPVTLDNGYAYYGANNSAGDDKNKSAFYYDAIAKIVAKDGIDWTSFDNDNNGKVDMAFFIYAGPGENGDGDEDTLWPQEQQTGGTQGGVSFGCYACCNETFNGTTDGIGAFVHELGHALGLPDFYDTNYVAYGMDSWDIMDYGCYCDEGHVPCNMTAYERDFMGWTPLVTLTPGTSQNITLYPTSHNGKGYKIVNQENEDEYYVIENRQNIDWDLYVGLGTDRIKHHGMMVTHVDYKRSRWTGNSVNTDKNHQRMTIIPADGTVLSQMYTDSEAQYKEYVLSAAGDLFPGSKQVAELTGEQAYVFTSTGETPHQMNQPLTNITEHEDGTITLTFCGDATDISALFANTEENIPVYNIAGVKVSYTTVKYGKPIHLPSSAGLYIVKGKKYIKQ
jgi:M6 family metalloprotease-like protein